MNLQVIASPGSDIRFVSGALPGSVHDRRPSRPGESLTTWRPPALSPSPIRAPSQGSLHAKVAYRGKIQARFPETDRPCSREASGTQRKGKRAAQELENPPQAPLLPRRAGQLAKAIHALEIQAA
jgi:hypothetical protein